MNWKGVISAMTTGFKPDYSVDHAFVAKHAQWQLENGCDGIVAPGSLGESATLTFDEKVALLKTLVGAARAASRSSRASPRSAPPKPSTLAQAPRSKRAAPGLMVLPPYVYASDWREMKAHVQAVLRATKLSCMLYNNPAGLQDRLPAGADRRSSPRSIRTSTPSRNRAGTCAE